MGTIMVRSEYTRNGRQQMKQFNIKDAICLLDDQVIRYSLVIHAFGGCDTTSAVHDKGKSGILRLVQRSKRAQELCKVFMETSTTEVVGTVGVELFVLLYGGKSNNTFQQLRYVTYMKMAASSTKISPSKLPPTERSAWYHSLRVYLQVSQWKSLMEGDLNPLDWGWKIENGKMTPIMTDQVCLIQKYFNRKLRLASILLRLCYISYI